MKTVSLRVSIIVVVILAACSFPAMADVDLTNGDIYVRRGFDTAWTRTVPFDDEWERLPPRPGKRLLSIPESGLTGLPRRHFLSLERHTSELFTIVIPVTLTENDLAVNNHQALYLAYLGGNWEIFFNGTSIAQEWHVDTTGAVSMVTNIRNLLIPLDPRLLRAGNNIIAIRVLGDPTYVTTGLYQAGPYLVGPLDELRRRQSETLSLVLFGIYLFFGLYHLFFFLLRREDRHNLFFGLFALSYFFYQISRTRVIYNLIEDVRIIDRLELIFIFMVLPLVISFIDTVQQRTMGLFVRLLWCFYGLLAVLVIATPLPFTYDIQVIWQYSLFIPFTYIIFYQMIYRLALFVRDDYRARTGGGAVRRFIAAAGRAMSTTVTGKLFFGVIIMVACGIFDNIDGLYLHVYLNLTRFGFLLLIFGTALILAGNFIFVHRQVATLNENLEQKIVDLQEANRAVSQSEEKYRLLVEGSSAAIFTITPEGRLLTANNTLHREQHVDPRRLSQTNITDFLHRERGGIVVVEKLLKEKIDECIASKGMRSLKVNFHSQKYNEPREMLLRLEYIHAGRANEILCRATPALKDSLLQFLIAEQQTYSISNHFTVAEEITHRLVRNVERYLVASQLNLLRLSVREIILNAIEHGNLEISFDDKTRATTDGDYLQYLESMRDRPVHRDRRVTIDYRLCEDAVTYTISDQGAGFDHATFLDKFINRANDEMLAHGRGISMAINFFDRVEFNRQGNVVTLMKKFSTIEAGQI